MEENRMTLDTHDYYDIARGAKAANLARLAAGSKGSAKTSRAVLLTRGDEVLFCDDIADAARRLKICKAKMYAVMAGRAKVRDWKAQYE
jgi:inactivated superfamily I helicase